MGSNAVREPRALDRLFWPLCLLLALLVRIAGFRQVFTPGRTLLVGTDAWYHLRRIAQTVYQFPDLPSFDPYLGHPFGALCPYEPGFDLLLASLARLFLGRGAQENQIATLCAAIPPLLGLLCLPLYATVARRFAGEGAARATALLLALLPGTVLFSAVGQVDHHVLEPLVMGLPLLAAISLLEAPGDRRLLLLTALTLGAGLFFWRGLLLPASLLALALAARALLQALQGPVDAFSRYGAALLFGLAALVAFPIGMSSPVHDRLSYFAISLLQPLTLALLGVSLLILGLGSHLVAERAARKLLEPLPRLGLLCLPGLLALLPFILASLLPGFSSNLLTGLGFLSRATPFVQAVTEQKPLYLNDDGRFSPFFLIYFYGAFAFVAPLLVGLGFRLSRQSRRGPLDHVLPYGDHAFILFAAWSLATLCLAFLQRRYAVIFTPVYAVWLGMGLSALRQRFSTFTTLKQVLCLGSGLLLSLPTGAFLLAQAVTPAQPAALLQAMDWIRLQTPPTSGYDLQSRGPGFVPPEYAVLAGWEEGHHLLTLAHRPNVANPFGIEWFSAGLERAARFWLAPGALAATTLDATGARYALLSFRLGLLRPEARFLAQDPDDYALPAPTGWRPGPAYLETAAARLYLQDGLATTTSPAISGLRLVWEGGTLEAQDPATAFLPPGSPVYKLFERVPGCLIYGQAPPRTRVTIQVRVLTPTGRHFTWASAVEASPQGRFALTVPYAVDTPASWARADGPAQIAIGTLTRQVTVPAECVAGGTLPIAPL